jgi:hypothetical protein
VRTNKPRYTLGMAERIAIRAYVTRVLRWRGKSRATLYRKRNAVRLELTRIVGISGTPRDPVVWGRLATLLWLEGEIQERLHG